MVCGDGWVGWRGSYLDDGDGGEGRMETANLNWTLMERTDSDGRRGGIRRRR